MKALVALVTLVCHLRPVQLEFEDECGGVFHGNYGEITSPGYPGTYPDGMDCTYHISRPDAGPIFVNFKSFELEERFDCSYDFVKIYDGPDVNSTLIATFCGSNAVALWTSSNEMTLIFSSDASMAYAGFRILYGGPFEDQCGGTLVGNAGALASPSYPNTHIQSQDCLYHISRPSGPVALSFLDFELESHSMCAYEYVSVFDGPTKDDPFLATYCGDGAREVLASGTEMTILFHTDTTKAHAGFWAHWGEPDCVFWGGFCSHTGCHITGDYSCHSGAVCCMDNCNLYQHKICPDGSCIDFYLDCDRQAHPLPTGIDCPQHGQMCSDGSCISTEYYCPCASYEKRCWDGSCILGGNSCPCNSSALHRCQNGNGCYGDDQWCNGHGDCADWSDEINCSDNATNDSGSTWIFIVIAMFAIVICLCIVIASVRRQYNHRRALSNARRGMQTAISNLTREDGRHVYDNPGMDSPPAYNVAVHARHPEAPPPSYESSIPRSTLHPPPQAFPAECPPAYDTVSHITSGFMFVDGVVIPKPEDVTHTQAGIAILMTPISQPRPQQPSTTETNNESSPTSTEAADEVSVNIRESPEEEEVAENASQPITDLESEGPNIAQYHLEEQSSRDQNTDIAVDSSPTYLTIEGTHNDEVII